MPTVAPAAPLAHLSRRCRLSIYAFMVMALFIATLVNQIY
jgi:hypothetical protein